MNRRSEKEWAKPKDWIQAFNYLRNYIEELSDDEKHVFFIDEMPWLDTHENDIDACVGYLVQDGQKDTDQRVYTLVDDTEHNYLMEYYVASDLMNQPTFWRAIDTKEKEIVTPEFIDSLEYSY